MARVKLEDVCERGSSNLKQVNWMWMRHQKMVRLSYLWSIRFILEPCGLLSSGACPYDCGCVKDGAGNRDLERYIIILQSLHA